MIGWGLRCHDDTHICNDYDTVQPKSLSGGAIQGCHALEVVGSPSLEVFKRFVAVALRAVV